jgi:hypothetical protein
MWFDRVPRRGVGWVGLEVVAQAAVPGQGDESRRGAPPYPAVGQLAADDDRAWFGGGQVVAPGQGEPVRPGVLEGSGRVAGRPSRGELRAEAPCLLVGRFLLVAARGRVHVAGVGEHVGSRIELGELRGPAIPAEQQHRGEGVQVGADQVERVVAGQHAGVGMQFPEGLESLGRRAQRELTARPAAVWPRDLPPAVEDAADPGQVWVHREPGPAGLLVTPADQR